MFTSAARSAVAEASSAMFPEGSAETGAGVGTGTGAVTGEDVATGDCFGTGLGTGAVFFGVEEEA